MNPLSAYAARQHAARAAELSNIARSLTWHANNDQDATNLRRKQLHTRAAAARAEAKELREKAARLRALN